MRYLDTVLAEFKGGFQSSARYEVRLYPSQAFLDTLRSGLINTIIDVLLPTIGQRLDPNFSMPNVIRWLRQGLICKTASTPDRQLETTSQTLYGITEKFPYATEHTDFVCTFLMPFSASDCPVPRFFHHWQNFIHNATEGPSSGLDFRFPDEYYANMELNLIDHRDNKSLTYRFEKVYPTTVESQTVAWENSNQALESQVRFAYSWFTVQPYEPPPLIEINIPI